MPPDTHGPIHSTQPLLANEGAASGTSLPGARKLQRQAIRRCLSKALRRVKGACRLSPRQRRRIIAWCQRKLDRTPSLLRSGWGKALLVASIVMQLSVATSNAAGPFVVDINNPVAGITGNKMTAIAFGDIDGDGNIDLLVGDETTGTGTSAQLRYFKNTGTRTAPVFTLTTLPTGIPAFVPNLPNSSTANPLRVRIPTIGDFDHDGLQDVILADSLNPTV